MPKAFDIKQYPADFSPLKQFGNYQLIGDLATQFADFMEALVPEMLSAFISEFQALTGLDLQPWIDDLQVIVKLITDLFGELNPGSAQYDPSAAVQTFFTLVKDLLADIPDIFTVIWDIVTTVLGDLFDGLVTRGESLLSQIWTNLIHPIISALTKGVGNVTADLTSMVDASILGAGTMYTNLLGGGVTIADIEKLTTNLVSGSGGTPPLGSVIGHDEALHALLTQNDLIKSHSTDIGIIKAILATLTGGVSASDSFNYANGNLPSANWSWGAGMGGVAGHGGIAVVDDEVVWVLPSPANGSSQDYPIVWVGENTVSDSDFQQVSIVLDTQGGTDTIDGNTSYDDVLLRVGSNFNPNASSTWTFIRARFHSQQKMFIGTVGSNAVELQAVVGGVEFPFASIPLPSTPAGGCTLTVLVGDKAGVLSGTALTAEWISVQMNNQPIYTGPIPQGFLLQFPSPPGTFTITADGATTASMTWQTSLTAAAVQSALSAVLSETVSVSGNIVSGFTISGVSSVAGTGSTGHPGHIISSSATITTYKDRAGYLIEFTGSPTNFTITVSGLGELTKVGGVDGLPTAAIPLSTATATSVQYALYSLGIGTYTVTGSVSAGFNIIGPGTIAVSSTGSGSATAIGFRGWGMGMGTDGGLIQQATPGNIGAWVAQDQ